MLCCQILVAALIFCTYEAPGHVHSCLWTLGEALEQPTAWRGGKESCTSSWQACCTLEVLQLLSRLIRGDFVSKQAGARASSASLDLLISLEASGSTTMLSLNSLLIKRKKERRKDIQRVLPSSAGMMTTEGECCFQSQCLSGL